MSRHTISLCMQTMLIAFWALLGSGSIWAEQTNLATTYEKTVKQSGPWVMVFNYEIEGVYIPAESSLPGKPITPESVVVALYDRRESPKHKLRISALKNPPLIRLANYSIGKEGQAGCLFFAELGRTPGLKTNRICQKIKQKAIKKLRSEFDACIAQIPPGKDMGRYRLFVTKDIMQSQCLENTYMSNYQWLASSVKPRQKTINTLAIDIESDNIRGKGGVRGYLNLETNKLFGCGSYGIPLSYWRKDIVGQEEQYEYKYYLDQATWQKQYLIKTNGFRYCWNAWRLIDEPENLGPVLNDGTALMWGKISALRVNLEDGSTKAPISQVKVIDAASVRQLLDQYGAQECRGDLIAAGDCRLTTIQAKHLPADWREQDYYPRVIQAVDMILQKLFNPKKSTLETFK